MTSRRVTVKWIDRHPDHDDHDVTETISGFSFVVGVADHDLTGLRARIQRQFRLPEAVDVTLLDADDGTVIGDVDQLVDRHQLQLQVRARCPSSSRSSSPSSVTDSDSDSDWIADHRFCLFPALIRSPMGQQRARAVLARVGALGATLVADGDVGVFRTALGVELRLSASAVPVAIPVPCAVTDLIERRWVVLLCHGGYFAGAVLDAGRLIAHRTRRRYVRRRCQGRRQASYESGSGHTSAGGQLRHQQEAAFRADVAAVLRDWAAHLLGADLVHVHAPGQHNRAALFPPDGPLQVGDGRVRPVPVSAGRALLREALRIARTLAMVELRTPST